MDRRAHSFSVDHENGFTLVEILVSLIILLILVVAFVPMFTFVAQAVSNNQGKDTATALANQTIEDLRSLPFIVKDPESGLIEEDPSIPQLGLKNGDPPGSVEPEQKKTINGKEYTIKTNIEWDNTMYYKKVSVSVEYPSAFNNTKVISKFYTAAAEEGDLDLPAAGYIKVMILDQLGLPFTDESIEVKVEPHTAGQSTLVEDTSAENGENLFGLIKTGSYMVSAHIGSKAYSPEQVLINGWLVQNNIEVSDKNITPVIFYIDYPAKISLRMEAESNTVIKGNGIAELRWTDGTNTKIFSPVEFNANSFVNNTLPSSLFGNLWPGGNYSIKIRDVLDSSSLRAYKEYDMSASGTPKPKLNGSAWDGTLVAGETAALEVEYFTLANSLLKTHLILDPDMINNPSLSAGYVELDNDTSDNMDHVVKWLDQSGKNNHATAQADAAKQPVIGGNPDLNRTWITFDGNSFQKLTIPSASRCADNFTIFVMAKPEGSQTITQPSTPSQTGTYGTSGQHFLFWPDWGGGQGGDGNSHAGQGLSLGTNGISNYEHAAGYLPVTALYSGTNIMQPWRVIAVKYEEKRPSIYVNSVLQTTGYQSLRTGNIYTPTQIGGQGADAWSMNPSYSGSVAAVLIYDTALNEANMKLVNDHLRNRFGLPEGVN